MMNTYLRGSLRPVLGYKKHYWVFGAFFLIWTGYLLVDRSVVLTWTAEEPTRGFNEIVTNLLLEDFDEDILPLKPNVTRMNQTAALNSTPPSPSDSSTSSERTFISMQELIYQQRNDRVNDVCQHLDALALSTTGSPNNQTMTSNKTKGIEITIRCELGI